MRTYEDSFSFQRIYPGKVRYPIHFPHRPTIRDRARDTIRDPDRTLRGKRERQPILDDANEGARFGRYCAGSGEYRQLRTNISLLQGKLFVRGDSKVFRFQNGKSESLFLQRKNPRRIAWTVLFRRQHRKGISEVRSNCLLCLATPPQVPLRHVTIGRVLGE